MRQFSLLFLFFLFCGYVKAQEPCKTFSLHETYEMVKVLNFSTTEQLTYKNYPSFNFKDFKPVEGPLDESEFYKIGFDKKNEVSDIIYQNKKDSLKYRMKVFNYEDRRILTLGTLEVKSRDFPYYYWPVAIIMDKRNGFNYLIGTSSMVKHYFGGRIWVEDYDKISSAMILDENLLPTDLFRFRNGQVVYYSQIKCLGNQVTQEYGHLYYLQYDHGDLKIDFNTCPEILKRNCRYETPDLSFHVCPTTGNNGRSSIWIHLLSHNER
jgi:hypothetical protein